MSLRKKISHARELLKQKPWLPKTFVAREFNISRATLYRTPVKQAAKDKDLLGQILAIHKEHPWYGHRRLSIVLGRSKNTLLRVMRKYGLKALHRRRKHPRYAKRPDSGIPNRTHHVTPVCPNAIWAGDFTEFLYHGLKVYVATVIDLYTREIVGWNIGTHHTAAFVVEALESAVRRRRTVPYVFHSDQGSEYDSNQSHGWLLAHRVLPSHSPKASPWRNGFQESFYNTFKFEVGSLRQFRTLDEVLLKIYDHIHYYNCRRLHGKLEMIPAECYVRAVEEMPFSLRRIDAKHLSTGV